MAFGSLAFGWPQPVLPGSVPTPPNLMPFGANQAPSYRSQTDTSEVALRAGGLPTVTPTQNRTNAAPPPMVPELAEVDQVMQEGQDRPILNGIRSFAENLRSGSLSERIGQNRNALLGMGAALATPSGGVMGPNMGAFAANLSSGMQMDEQAAQQRQSDEALTALFQSPDFAALPEQYRNLLMSDPELGRAFAMDMLSQAMAPQGGLEPTDDIQEYQFAVQNGFQGSFADWMEIRAPGGTTVNVGQSEYGTIPQGWELFTDPDTGARSLRPIQGGPAERELQAAEQAAETRRANDIAQGQIVLQNIDRALENANFWTTGFMGALTDGIPGTPAFDLAQTVITIQANIGFDQLQQLRDESPTGGALGQVAIQELVALQASLGNLATSQSEAQFRENLEVVREQYLNIVHGSGNWSRDQSGTLWLRGQPQNGWVWVGGDPADQNNWQRAQ